MRISTLGLLLILVAPAATARAQDGAEPAVFVNALAPTGQLLVVGEPVRAGQKDLLYPDEPVDYVWGGPVEGRRATLFSPDLGVSLTITGLDVTLEAPADGGLRVMVEPGDVVPAFLDLIHNVAGMPVEIVLEETTVTLARGAVRLTRTAPGAWQIVASDGQATVADGAASRVIEAAGENQIAVGPDGLASPTSGGTGLDSLLTEQSRVTRAALLPDLVRVAESVAEGDLEPPTRGSRVAAAAVAPSVRVKEIVPRGSFVTRVDNRAVSSLSAAAGQTLAETFIGSGEAALAVVGARLQRTRVVGVSGVGGSALSINRELTLPFTLAPLRR